MANYSTHSDPELLTLLKEGDQRALDEIYSRYWDKLLLVAANLLDNPEEAEECIQDVFLSLWNRRQNLELRQNLQGYLAVSVKYQSITIMNRNHRRRLRTETYGPLPADTPLSPSPEAEYIAKELLIRLEQSINELPPQCRLVFKLKTEEGKSNQQIADELDISENTVKMHLKNANKNLRDDLLILLPFLLSILINRAA